jgi:hypothetical protein
MFPNRGRRCRSPIAIDDRSSVAIRAYNDVATAPISDGATDLHAGDADATGGAFCDLIFAVQNLAVRHGHSDRASPQSAPLKVNSGSAGLFRGWIERKKAGVIGATDKHQRECARDNDTHGSTLQPRAVLNDCHSGPAEINEAATEAATIV